jgi:hypothetical protein
MKFTALLLGAGLSVIPLLCGVDSASAVVCARGAYHAGCVGARGAVVRPRGAVVVGPHRAVVVRPRGRAVIR